MAVATAPISTTATNSLKIAVRQDSTLCGMVCLSETGLGLEVNFGSSSDVVSDRTYS